MPSENGPLDATNLRLLAELMEDARLSQAELGRRVGLSAPAVAERLARLERDGVITGYRTEVAPAALGYALAAVLRMRPAPRQIPKVADVARATPEVVECHRVTGEDCFYMKLHVRSVEHLEEVIDRFTPYGQTTTSIIQSSPVARRGLGFSVRAHGTVAFYIGGFLGPFGGGVVAVLVPQLRDAFDATTAGVAASIPAYLVPFAVLQLISGTVGERLGRRRVVRTGYIAYALLSLAAAFAPSLGAFLVVRALQGSANAFLTPLLLAGLADEVPARRLGRAVGTFAAVQTAAIALAPLGGGALGAIDWRLAFVSQAVVAAALGLVPPRDGAARAVRPRLRTVLTRRVGLLCAASFTGYAGVTGLGFLVAVLAADDFGLSSIARGVLLAGFGVAGIVLGRAAGDAADRYGRVQVAYVGIALCTVLVALLGLAPTPVALGALWFGCGLGSTLVWAGINTLAVEAVPENRAGGTSVISAFRFAGNAAAPLMWLPLYHADHRLGFAGAAVLAALTASFILPLRVPR